jgi:two-component system LytT family response regulator
MINAIIIDDEPAARASLALEIHLHCPQITVIAEASSVAEGVETLENNPHAELLFLDIQLTDGSGFDLLQKINFDHLKIIFTTAYSEYALRAIKFAPLDYLLKPIDAQELKSAVEKVPKGQQSEMQAQIRAFMHQISGASAPPRIALATSDGIHLHYVKNIVRCASDGNYATVHFDDRSKLLVAKTLKDLEILLSPTVLNVYTNRTSSMWTISKRYYNRFSGEVEMSDGAILPVAQRKKTQLLELLGKVNV